MTNYFILGIVLSVLTAVPLSAAHPKKESSQAERLLQGFLGGSEKDANQQGSQCRNDKKKMLRFVREDLRAMLKRVDRALDDLS